MQRIYEYDHNGEYLESDKPVYARESPLEPGVFLIPANATAVAPPEAVAGKARIFDGAAWTLAEDHRGETVWRKADALAVTVDWIGAVGEGYTALEPCAYPAWDAEAGAWSADDAAVAAARKSEILSGLAFLDDAAVRPLRAVLAAQLAGADPDAEDTAKLAEIETNAQALRAELAELED